ncbi:unnamed protein product [Eruca vesicaria subsp. sativa]|uniref:KIB1-4 beta-propeller domain-containing protein n=1 Tax=Eruca vesicaria subsp. sativa TaxID=29727 RepID=A0ABC8M075_ERUVS|nr:unnamed protein product [Eruca vesicaria subsp. sativa]
MSYLLFKDNIRASAVCKAWRKAAEYVRVVEKHPWVISISYCGNLIDFFDPLQWKKYTLNLPEIAESFVSYSKNGWLLMRRKSFVDLFFFNPYTREIIKLPKYNLLLQKIAFSSARTSDTCVSVTNIVYANGHFFYFAEGILFDFDPASRTLNHQAWDEYRRPHKDNDESSRKEEISNDILDGLTIFVSRYSSETRMDVLGMRNSVYLAKYIVHPACSVNFTRFVKAGSIRVSF